MGNFPAMGQNLESACKAYAWRTLQQKKAKEEAEWLERMEEAWDAYLRHFAETGER